MGVSGAGCLAGLRKGVGTESGEIWWKISGRRRKEKSLDVTGAVDGAGDLGAGDRGSGLFVREPACWLVLKRAACDDMGDNTGAL